MKYLMIWTLFFPGYPPVSFVNSYHYDEDDCIVAQGAVNRIFESEEGKQAKLPRIQTSCRPVPVPVELNTPIKLYSR